MGTLRFALLSTSLSSLLTLAACSSAGFDVLPGSAEDSAPPDNETAVDTSSTDAPPSETFDPERDSDGDGYPAKFDSDTDGCETSTTTATDCGGCGKKCDTATSVGAACATGTTCTYSGCAAGFKDCVTTAPDYNGCETSVSASLTDCGDCGRTCSSASVSTLACAGGVCTSTCAAGFVNCKKPVAPASDDGCECAGTACCGAGLDTCQPAHSNGLGQSYYDCAALGTPGTASTYTATMATEARAAWPFSGTDSPCSCTGPGSPQCVYRKTATTCAVWVYIASASGHVYLNTVDSSCLCATTSDPTWN